MNKYYIFGLIGIALVLIFIVFDPFKPKAEKVLSAQSKQPTPTQTISTTLPSGAEKIEVLHFHAIKQCISCINIGKFTKATVEEKFPEEFKSGKIVFREINIDFPENSKIAQDYKVSGSALYINVIKDGLNHKELDTTVWRLVTDELQLKKYFEAKLKALL